jgi:putative PIN family toxin of toxin-antitoxin system
MKPVPEWVIDTNILVSGLLTAQGPPGRLVDAILARRLRLAFDDRIIAEYRSVLARPKFCFNPEDLAQLWEILPYQRHLATCPSGELEAADPADTKFLEVAAASASKILVSGNMRHFPRSSRGPVLVLSPAEAVQRLMDNET